VDSHARGNETCHLPPAAVSCASAFACFGSFYLPVAGTGHERRLRDDTPLYPFRTPSLQFTKLLTSPCVPRWVPLCLLLDGWLWFTPLLPGIYQHARPPTPPPDAFCTHALCLPFSTHLVHSSDSCAPAPRTVHIPTPPHWLVPPFWQGLCQVPSHSLGGCQFGHFPHTPQRLHTATTFVPSLQTLFTHAHLDRCSRPRTPAPSLQPTPTSQLPPHHRTTCHHTTPHPIPTTAAFLHFLAHITGCYLFVVHLSNFWMVTGTLRFPFPHTTATCLLPFSCSFKPSLPRVRHHMCQHTGEHALPPFPLHTRTYPTLHTPPPPLRTPLPHHTHALPHMPPYTTAPHTPAHHTPTMRVAPPWTDLPWLGLPLPLVGCEQDCACALCACGSAHSSMAWACYYLLVRWVWALQDGAFFHSPFTPHTTHPLSPLLPVGSHIAHIPFPALDLRDDTLPCTLHPRLFYPFCSMTPTPPTLPTPTPAPPFTLPAGFVPSLPDWRTGHGCVHCPCPLPCILYFDGAHFPHTTHHHIYAGCLCASMPSPASVRMHRFVLVLFLSVDIVYGGPTNSICPYRQRHL